MTVTTETLRGTGRTTRMLARARELAEQGRAVYVIADSFNQQQALRALVHDHPNGPQGIQVEVPGGLGNFDWNKLRLIGANPKCVVLVDHYAIEQRFAALLEELHRYDPQEQKADTP